MPTGLGLPDVDSLKASFIVLDAYSGQAIRSAHFVNPFVIPS